MPAETAVNVTGCVKVFRFCLSQSPQRNPASAQREQGTPLRVALVPMFSSLGENLLWSFAVLSPLHKPSDEILPATQHHQRRYKNCALPLDAKVVMLRLTLTALNSFHAAYRKKI